ncbi:hypothetical protein HDU67_008821 [Dinochytrium kinnereticum]|nr:hypothetical protein HDU67_008821 [Dinochytrium kinnereticum]
MIKFDKTIPISGGLNNQLQFNESTTILNYYKTVACLISVAVEPITIVINDEDDEEHSGNDNDSSLEECPSEDYDSADDDENKIDLAAASAEGWIRTLFNKRVKLGRIPKPILFNFCDWIHCPREKKKYQGPVPKAVDDVRMPVFIRSYADVVARRGL